MIGIKRKHSKKRDAILELIQSTASHPGAQWIYDRLKPSIPNLSLATVYRNINLFRQEGILASVGVVKGEERFDSDVSPHPHFVCVHCGRVEDLPGVDPEKIEALGKIPSPESGDAPDFVIDYRKTVFYGLCGGCRGGEKT
jgi:Fur family peroxide stress response transcriptional regulator